MDVLILAGGEARRLRGADKPLVEVGGKTLLDRVIEACVRAQRTLPGSVSGRSAAPGALVVVGPRRNTEQDVHWVREDPPGGGPAAAIAAGLAACSDPWVGVFAADLPFLTPATVHSLWTAAARAEDSCDGAIALDGEGRDQWLAAVYRRTALVARLADYETGGLSGLSLRRLAGDLRLLRVAQAGDSLLDCDTWEDVDAARRLAGSDKPTAQ